MSIIKLKGFSLIEMSIVLLIISVLLSYSLSPLRTQIENKHIKATHLQLAEIEQALYGFAIANQRLPCPTLPGKGGIAQPAELSPSTPVVSGADSCDINMGFIPATTLGIKGKINCDGLLIDPWGRAYRYSVTSTDASDNGDDFVVSGQLKNPENGGEGISAVKPNLLICNNLDVSCSGSPSAVVVSANTAVAVIFSMGSKLRKNSNFENENAGEGEAILSTCKLPDYPIANDRYYYAATRREIKNKKFDDILIWISPNILYAKMLTAGVIP